MKFRLQNVDDDLNAFKALVDLYEACKNCSFSRIEIDMQAVRFFSAHMCAVLGAIFYALGKNLNTIILINIEEKVGNALSRNGFLTHYGCKAVPDGYRTTISYGRFDVEEGGHFYSYVERELMHRNEIPTMSHDLTRSFKKSIYEVFDNSVLHSRTDSGIFCCGQVFPQRKLLRFTLVDLGIGIAASIRERLSLDFPADKAIVWATEDKNTTRRGSEFSQQPGGVGLKIISEFIDLNGGLIQILSGAGWWQRQQRQVTCELLDHPFPGTVVSLEINTADKKSYAYAYELIDKNIF